MNHKINARMTAIVPVTVLAILAALVAGAAASTSGAESYPGGYPAPLASSAPGAAIQTAQAAQSQNFQPGFVPQAPSQGGSRQTLTLPQVAPQNQPGPVQDIPAPQRGEEEVSPELPLAPQPHASVARIPVTATDDTGRWISDLRKQDLMVYEDGTQRPILGIQRDLDTPISIGIVVDTSGSMEWKLAAAKAALEHLVSSLNPRDQFFMMAFSDRAYLLQDFTNNPSDVTRAIGILHAEGDTALYDAVVMGLQKVERGRWPKRALLVMTDGMDNKSSHSLDETIGAARSGGVLIYTVGLGTVGGGSGIVIMGPTMMGPMFGRHMGFGGFGGFGGGRGGGEAERVDASTLRRLSDETGARTFVMNPRVSDMSRLDTYFQSISDELRQQYTVRYASAGGSRPHQIQVEGLREGIRVRAPKWVGSDASSGGSEPGG
ncbi:MAG: VWA domain-containing protein [Candidatus Binataceae bacterium]